MCSRGNCVLLPTSLTSTKFRSDTTACLRLMVIVVEPRTTTVSAVSLTVSDTAWMLPGGPGAMATSLAMCWPYFFDQLPTIRAGHRVRHDDRRLAEGSHDLAEARDHHVTGEIIEGDVTAAADAGPIRHHHLVAGADEGLSPARTPISGRKIARA